MTAESYKPGQLVMDRRKQFDKLNQFIAERGGWITSIPNDSVIVFDALEGSELPESLIRAGYDVVPANPPQTQRTIPNAIIQQFTLTSSGAFELLTEGSTKAIARTDRHSGITPVRRWQFGI